MSEWKPTIGKWDDETNYDIQVPNYKRMFNSISKYEESKEVVSILETLSNWNITSYDMREYIIGYVMYQKGLDLKLYISDNMMNKIKEYSLTSKDINEYSIKILKDCHISDDVINEIFKEKDLLVY